MFFRPTGALLLAGCLGLASLSSFAGRAFAEDTPLPAPAGAREQARQDLADGNRLFRAGDYEGAAREYRAAYALVPSEKLHFNVGLAEKMRGNAVEAARELDRFLASDAGQTSELRADAARYLDELAPLVATVRVQIAAGDHVLVDGVPVDGAASDRPIRLAPGAHQLIVRRDGHADWGKGLELVPGATETVVPEIVISVDRSPPALPEPVAPSLDAPAAPLPGPAPADADRGSPIYHRWWFWAVVAGVVGGGVTALALRGGNNAQTSCLESAGCHILMRE